MFGKKKRTPGSGLLTPQLVQLLARASVEKEAKNVAALERWGIGTADRWSADLAAGTVSFHFPDRTIVGPVEVLGSYSSTSETWMWGWANASLPTSVTGASRATLAHGRAHALTALTTEKMEITPDLADDFASITVELGDLAGFYRAPTNAGFIYLGFTDFA